MTSWCSTRRWWSTASFFPVVFGNSLSQKIHGTWSSRFESSFTGCSGNAKTSKPCCVWIPVTKYIISKCLHDIYFTRSAHLGPPCLLPDYHLGTEYSKRDILCHLTRCYFETAAQFPASFSSLYHVTHTHVPDSRQYSSWKWAHMHAYVRSNLTTFCRFRGRFESILR